MRFTSNYSHILKALFTPGSKPNPFTSSQFYLASPTFSDNYAFDAPGLHGWHALLVATMNQQAPTKQGLAFHFKRGTRLVGPYRSTQLPRHNRHHQKSPVHKERRARSVIFFRPATPSFIYTSPSYSLQMSEVRHEDAFQLPFVFLEGNKPPELDIFFSLSLCLKKERNETQPYIIKRNSYIPS